MGKYAADTLGAVYRILRLGLFRFESERVHTRMTRVGALLGKRRAVRSLLRSVLVPRATALQQTVAGITTSNPIGLAAGFDYKAQLPEILPSLGFGFGTVGTFSNQPYQGNPPPRLARLVRSRSLLVNKGFKNDGIAWLVANSRNRMFEIPIGLSIGRTNKAMSIDEAIQDIAAAFAAAEKEALPFTHYELNISCPNLTGTVSFYDPTAFASLLKRLTPRNLSKPLWLKMPIELTNEETRALAAVALEYGITALIIGNLQKDRSHPALVPYELAKCGKGHFSGKPTWDRSNELIRELYLGFGDRATIIGCGGVFSAEDAYIKIRLGASLVQLVTGLVFQGPQLPAQINWGLLRLLRRDGFASVTEAVGADVENKKSRRSGGSP